MRGVAGHALTLLIAPVEGNDGRGTCSLKTKTPAGRAPALARRRGYQGKSPPRVRQSHSGDGRRQDGVSPMDRTDFETERPRLTAIATRILGSGADAEDVVQDAWLRLSRTAEIDDPPAWLTTVVTRLCLDQLRKRRVRSAAEAEAPIDPAPIDPEVDALLAEKMGDAIQVVIDAMKTIAGDLGFESTATGENPK